MVQVARTPGSVRLGTLLLPLVAVAGALALDALVEPIVEPAHLVLLPLAAAGTAWVAGRGGGTLAVVAGAIALVGRHHTAGDGGWLGPVVAPAGLMTGAMLVCSALRRVRLDREQARRDAREQAARARRQTAERRAAFLAHASRVLASSSDYEAALRAVADLAVPQIADWCVVDLLQADGSIRTVVAKHVDPDQVRLIFELRGNFPVDPNARAGIAQVLRTGRAIVYPEISADLLQGLARDAHQLTFVEALGLRSVMSAPLLVGGRRLGVLSLMTAESGRRYVPADLSFAEDLARRAAVAIDTAADRAAGGP